MASITTTNHRAVPLHLGIAGAVVLLGLVACGGSGGSESSSDAEHRQAVELIAGRMEPNSLGISALNLEAKNNEFGRGIFVFMPKASADDDEPFAVWIVVGEVAYPLGIPAKLATPSLACPCNAPRGFWDGVGLNPYQSSKAFEKLVIGAGQ